MLVHVRVLREKLLKGSDPWEWSPARNMTDFCKFANHPYQLHLLTNWLALDIMIEYTLGAAFENLEKHFQRYIIDAVVWFNVRTGAYTQFPE